MLLCDEVKVTELVISDKIEDMKDYWFCSNKKFNHKDAINMRTYTTYRSTFKWDKFLKRLHFKGSYRDYDQLNLNETIGLEQLKIDLDSDDADLDHDDIDIILPHLKILEIEECASYVSLNTPKLEMLKCYEYELIRLNNPSTVKYVEVIFFNEATKTLNNIHHLNAEWQFLPNDNILSAFPKLTKIECNKFVCYDDDDDVESMASLRHLIKQKGKRPGLKIYFHSVDMVDTDKVKEYEFAQSILAFQIQNYDSLCGNIAFDNPLDYNHLMRLVNGTLPDDFYKKYFNIPSVCVNGAVKSQEHLIQFLKKLDYLKILRLENAFFDQKFYDGLNQICSLTELTIDGTNSIGNYNFLLNFKLLELFYTDRHFRDFRDLPITALFTSLKYFKNTHFYFDKEFIAIGKFRNVYSFSRYKDLVDGQFMREKLFEKRGMNWDELASFINTLSSVPS